MIPQVLELKRAYIYENEYPFHKAAHLFSPLRLLSQMALCILPSALSTQSPYQSIRFPVSLSSPFLRRHNLIAFTSMTSTASDDLMIALLLHAHEAQ
jgi:hypothetical protein